MFSDFFRSFSIKTGKSKLGIVTYTVKYKNAVTNISGLVTEKIGNKQTERQRDRETERQRDRETERQSDRETEIQRDREAERQRNRTTKRDRTTERLRKRKKKGFIDESERENRRNLKTLLCV